MTVDEDKQLLQRMGGYVDKLEELCIKYPVLDRFIKYGGWIAIQFWFVRAPMTVWFTNMFPDQINFIVMFPGYLLASFFSGSILAVVGFFLSEYWIWRKPKDEV